jgi:hypothetical protein
MDSTKNEFFLARAHYTIAFATLPITTMFVINASDSWIDCVVVFILGVVTSARCSSMKEANNDSPESAWLLEVMRIITLVFIAVKCALEWPSQERLVLLLACIAGHSIIMFLLRSNFIFTGKFLLGPRIDFYIVLNIFSLLFLCQAIYLTI